MMTVEMKIGRGNGPGSVANLYKLGSSYKRGETLMVASTAAAACYGTVHQYTLTLPQPAALEEEAIRKRGLGARGSREFRAHPPGGRATTMADGREGQRGGG